jgi:hypothetical protein
MYASNSQEHINSRSNGYKASPEFNLLLVCSWMPVWLQQRLSGAAISILNEFSIFRRLYLPPHIIVHQNHYRFSFCKYWGTRTSHNMRREYDLRCRTSLEVSPLQLYSCCHIWGWSQRPPCNHVNGTSRICEFPPWGAPLHATGHTLCVLHNITWCPWSVLSSPDFMY